MSKKDDFVNYDFLKAIVFADGDTVEKLDAKRFAIYEKFIRVLDDTLETDKISISLLQRKFSIGFGMAAGFIDTMEELGIISKPNGQKSRDVLMTKDEWREKLARATND